MELVDLMKLPNINEITQKLVSINRNMSYFCSIKSIKMVNTEEKDYIEALESLVCFYASVYEHCKETYQDKYLKMTDIRNPKKRKLTEFEEEILISFPQIQGTVNIIATEKLAKIKLNKRISLKKVAEIIESKYGI